MFPFLFLGLGLGLLAASMRQDSSPVHSSKKLPPANADKAKPNQFGIIAGDMRHSTSGDRVPTAGVQSHPDYQWSYAIQSADETPGDIAEKILGPEQAWRYVELLTANPQKPIKGKVVTPDPSNDELNFVSVSTNEVLFIPRTWNAWIDETGVPAGKNQHWPAPSMKGVA